MEDILCPAVIDKNLTSDLTLYVAQFVEHLTGNQGVASSIPISDSDYFLCIQLEKHFLSIKICICYVLNYI